MSKKVPYCLLCKEETHAGNVFLLQLEMRNSLFTNLLSCYILICSKNAKAPKTQRLCYTEFLVRCRQGISDSQSFSQSFSE